MGIRIFRACGLPVAAGAEAEEGVEAVAADRAVVDQVVERAAAMRRLEAARPQKP